MSDETKKPRVCVTCTTMGSMRIETAAALMQVQKDDRCDVSLQILHDRPYASALNAAAAQLCVDASFDWWLHIDNDESWSGNPLDAIADGKDLVGFPAPIYHPGHGAAIICLSAWDLVPNTAGFLVRPAAYSPALKQVDVIGSGSFLIRLDALRHAAIPAPFERSFDAQGVAVHGCDIEFCRKWRNCGLEVWADFRCLCHHYNTIDLLEVMCDMQRIQGESE